MFFILSKILYFLVSPLTWILILILIAFFAGEKWQKRLIIAVFICLLFFSNNHIFNLIVRKWEGKAVNENDLKKKYKYGIVLSGMATYLGDVNRVNFQGASDRLWQAVYLYKKGIIQNILLSGGSGSLLNPGDYESLYLKDYLISVGIPDSVILVESTSRNTYENAVYSAQILAADTSGYQLLLITSGYHMARSLACFRKAGLNPDPFPTHLIYQWSPSIWRDLLVPDVRALYYWDALIHEWIGFLVYKLVGYA